MNVNVERKGILTLALKCKAPPPDSDMYFWREHRKWRSTEVVVRTVECTKADADDIAAKWRNENGADAYAVWNGPFVLTGEPA